MHVSGRARRMRAEDRQPVQSSGVADVSRTVSIDRSSRDYPAVREARLDDGNAFEVGVIVHDADASTLSRVSESGRGDLQITHTDGSSATGDEQPSLQVDGEPRHFDIRLEEDLRLAARIDQPSMLVGGLSGESFFEHLRQATRQVTGGEQIDQGFSDGIRTMNSLKHRVVHQEKLSHRCASAMTSASSSSMAAPLRNMSM